jgi:hypothetical protein
MGKPDMKPSNYRLFGQAVRAAGVGAALLLSVSAAHAQSSPFAGFKGVWSGNGTVSLSDGSSERIRCRATYAVDGSGRALQQTLRCASDSYKFDLSSNVTSQGNRSPATGAKRAGMSPAVCKARPVAARSMSPSRPWDFPPT